MDGGDLGFSIETPRLREVIDRIKGVDAKLATNLRRELRQSGAQIIDAQRDALRNKPGKIVGSERKLTWIQPRGRAGYFAFRRTYQVGDPVEGGVSNLRDKIGDGLRARVQTGQRTQGVQVKTTGPRNGGANMARVWQAARFRHPVFGDRSAWAIQAGAPYFFDPVTAEMRVLMRTRIVNAIEDALASIEH